MQQTEQQIENVVNVHVHQQGRRPADNDTTYMEERRGGVLYPYEHSLCPT